MTDPHAEDKDRRIALAAAALLLVYLNMREDVLSRVGVGVPLRSVWEDRVRFTATQQAKQTAAAIARMVDPGFDVTRMDAYLEKVSESFAETWAENVQQLMTQVEAVAQNIRREMQAALDRVTAEADRDASHIVRQAANLAAKDAARASGKTTKTWHTSSGDSRATHAAQNGMTIPIDDRFPNGLPYPMAPAPPAETVNCECYLTFGG